MSVWKDFSSAEDQQSFDVIPKGTIARVRMTIKPGGYNDPDQGWTGGYATLGDSGAVYLNCEFVVTEGPFARRKVWSLIGLHSPKGPTYANMGRSFIKGILNSARGFSAKDDSPQAMASPPHQRYRRSGRHRVYRPHRYRERPERRGQERHQDGGHQGFKGRWQRRRRFHTTCGAAPARCGIGSCRQSSLLGAVR
jgi:hypothetical protein